MSTWLFVIGLAISARAAQPAPAPVDQALVERFTAATTDADRRALVQGEAGAGAPEFAKALNALGVAELGRGDFGAARRTFGSLLWLGDYRADQDVRAIALANLGYASGQLGDLTEARTYLEEALAMAEARDDTEGIQTAANGLGIVMRRLGDHEGALASFARVITLAEAAGRQDRVARTLNNIGIVYQGLGNATLALDYYTRSLSLKEAGGAGPNELSSTLNNIGGMYDEQGDYEQAIDYYTRALAIGEANGGPSRTTSLSNLGHAYAALGRRDEARAYFERARASAEASGDKGRLGTVLFNLGTLARDEGRMDDADAYQRQSLAIRESLGGRIPLIESHTEIGLRALQRGDAAEALAHAATAIGLASESRLLNQLWKAQWLAAEAEEALGRTAEAIARHTQAIDTIETLRQLTAGGDRARLLYLPERLGPYYRLARLHAEAGRNADALAAVEHARSRVLLDILSDGAPAGRTLTPEQRARERGLTQAVVSWSSQISAEAARPAPDPTRLAALDAELARARLARDVFTEGLYDTQPGLRLARGREPIVGPGQLDRLVPDGTAIAEFVVEADQVWVYWIAGGPDGATITPQKLAVTVDELTRLSTRFAEQVATRNLGFAPTARALYDALFGGLDARMAQTHRLVVVPDGVLWRVPVQALRTPRGHFVIEERAVSYAPSISAFAALDARRRARAGRPEFLVAMADPAAGGPRGHASADRAGGPAPAALPEARREVRALARLYGPSRSAVAIGADATESTLAGAVGRASVLHVATHGVVDDQHPMYSHVLLAPSTGGGSESDGRLEAWEVMDLAIDADLVVLSACDTARGRWADGEGVVGLSWSFFAAGASAAVVSQWSVDSSSTTDLMIAFHRQRLQAHADAADALRSAARGLLATPAYRHPFYWAGFVVVGAP